MILFTNGCSWTWGGALEPYYITNDIRDDEKRLSLVWPHHLGQWLNADKVINLGMGCGSNQRIVRTTFDWLTTQNKETLEDTVAVIQFTEFNRFEMYESTDHNNQYENLSDNWLNCKVDMVTGPLPTKGKYFKDAHYISMKNKINERIANTTENELMYTTLSYIHSLQQMFDIHGVKQVYFWCHGNEWNRWPGNIIHYIRTNFNILQQNDIWNYDRMYGKIHEHPSPAGHKQLAKMLYTDMLRKGYVR